jgi:hypothetical protein
MDQATCSNCGRPRPPYHAGRCKSCHVYWQQWKHERPPAVRQGRPCVDCGQPTGARARVRCVPCFERHVQGRSLYHLPEA